MRNALGKWEAVSPLRFTELARNSRSDADILINFVRYDHGDGSTFDGRGKPASNDFAASQRFCLDLNGFTRISSKIKREQIDDFLMNEHDRVNIIKQSYNIPVYTPYSILRFEQNV